MSVHLSPYSPPSPFYLFALSPSVEDDGVASVFVKGKLEVDVEVLVSISLSLHIPAQLLLVFNEPFSNCRRGAPNLVWVLSSEGIRHYSPEMGWGSAKSGARDASVSRWDRMHMQLQDGSMSRDINPRVLKVSVSRWIYPRPHQRRIGYV